MARQCINPKCRAPIIGCFGFVLARDFLTALEGKTPYGAVRELCGKCVFRFEADFEALERILV